MPGSSKKPKVYFIPWSSCDRLPELLKRSGAADSIKAGDFAAVKMHFGEKGNDGYIKPEFVRPVLKFIREQKARAFLTDTNTIYRGQRANAVDHILIASEHGFSQTRLHVPVIIADGLKGDDYESVEIPGTHFKGVKIAGAIMKSDVIVALSHFKGHMLAGFGGAIKNLGMGCSARLGKFEMHSGVKPEVAIKQCQKCGECIIHCAHNALKLGKDGIILDSKLCAGCGECIVACDYGALSLAWEKGAAEVQERVAEYALGAVMGRRAFYVNFVNHVTPNCDCMSEGEESLLPDVGIFASTDPVAIDQACLDVVILKGGNVFAKVYPDIDCTIQLRHAEKVGLGKREYELVEI